MLINATKKIITLNRFAFKKLCSCSAITHVREHTQNIAALREAQRGSRMRQQIVATVRWHDFFSCAFLFFLVVFFFLYISRLVFENSPTGRTGWTSSRRFTRKVSILNQEAECDGWWLWGSDQNITPMLLKLVIWHFYDIRPGSIYWGERGRLHRKAFLTNGFLSGMCVHCAHSSLRATSPTGGGGAYAPTPPTPLRLHLSTPAAAVIPGWLRASTLDWAEWLCSDRTHTRGLSRALTWVSQSGDRTQNLGPSFLPLLSKSECFPQFSNPPLRRARECEREKMRCWSQERFWPGCATSAGGSWKGLGEQLVDVLHAIYIGQTYFWMRLK